MPKEYPGIIQIGFPFELQTSKPPFDYMVVNFLTDLDTLNYQFVGMKVFVEENQKEYIKKATGWTLSGDGTYLSLISHDSTLSGDGTVLNPLGVIRTFENITLSSSLWLTNQITVTAPGVTTNNYIIIGAPLDRNQFLAFGNNGISCISQGLNSLTFKCLTTPNIDITLNIEIK